MADTVPERYVWVTPTYASFLAVNPTFPHHSSRLIVDPEVPVSIPAPPVTVETTD